MSEHDTADQPVAPGPFDPVSSPPGSAEEEATGGTEHYLDVLSMLHAALRPGVYLEIGVRHGRSLSLAGCPAIGVDPAPEILVGPLPFTTRLFEMTSDEFFAGPARQELVPGPDLAFIDGMHLFEFALRDFMHIERLAGPGALVVIDDIFPSHPAQAERTRRTRVWTGDLWKLYRCLAEERPDLVLIPLDTRPTGLLLVAGLDPGNTLLWDRYDSILLENAEQQPPPAAVMERQDALAPGAAVVVRVLAALRDGREANDDRDRIVEVLRSGLGDSDS